ncbi:hypothetical protein D1164_16460 [Mariniphaga sediminis]|jgi:hypothetical protein|uniref:NigD-like C-terminal domain-containing protein n=1 Tax=Mariniphaga sediminis TaxID=1628158 RepID=A0A399CXS0_9BACT|nr:NigD-like protein [Mariniphaga sediminis]RIH64147.1 hypothetical protein D1164_16460 [Mariniphaga sediminis]
MKKYALFILLGLMVFTTSCLDDDGYSLGRMWVGFGMVEQVNSDPMEYQINMDNGDKLIPVASGYRLPWYYYGTNDPESRLKTGDRILINYTILDDDAGDDGQIENYYIKVNSVKKILLKGILDITEENQDSIGNDPVIVKECWMTDSLLNFEIKYWGRYEVHYINLVKEPGELTADDQPIELELRHNDNGDMEDIPYAAYVSFNLEEIQIAGLDSVKFRVTSTDYDDDLFEYEGTYHYGDSE